MSEHQTLYRHCLCELTIHYEFLSTLGGSGLIGNFYKQCSKGRISEQNLLRAKHIVKLGKLSHGYLKTVDAESMLKLYCVRRVILLNAEVNHAKLKHAGSYTQISTNLCNERIL